jgi:hypothetical protein
VIALGGTRGDIDCIVKWIRIKSVVTANLPLTSRAANVLAAAKRALPINMELDPDAASQIRIVQDKSTTWNTSGTPPSVAVNLVCENGGLRRVRCQVRVESGHLNRVEDSLVEGKYRTFDSKVIGVVLEPNEEKMISCKLTWFRTEATKPTLRYPNPADRRSSSLELLSCTFAD